MIGLLNAYHFERDAESYQLDYGPMFLDFLAANLPGQIIRNYDVALGEFPQSVHECDGWIITGSPKSAYDNDPWIKALGGFVQRINKEKIKLVGVCFGHQLVAHYLGGRTEKSENGWGVGISEFDIVSNKKWMKPPLEECALIFSHQDQVLKLPKDAELLGTNDFCPNQMYSIGTHIFCMQGHPEFTTEFAKGRLDARMSLIGQEMYEQAVESLGQESNAVEVGSWIHEFMKG